jgi:hypothetical protein
MLRLLSGSIGGTIETTYRQVRGHELLHREHGGIVLLDEGA